MKFLYEATDTEGRSVLGKMDAGSEAEVQRQLQSLGYSPQLIALVAPVGEAVQAVPVAPPLSALPAACSVPAPAPVARSVSSVARTSAAMGLSQTGAQPVGRSGGIVMAGNAARVGARTFPATSASARANPFAAAAPAGASSLGGVSTRELMFFFQQLASLVKSGMTIFAALDNLAARTLNRNLAKAAGEMALAAHAGKPVSGVMAAYPAIFPEHISGMVRAGELGGFLEIVLAEIALTYEENIALYRGAWVAKSMAAQALFVLPLAIPLFPIVFRSFDFRTNLRTYALTEAVLLPLTGVLYLGIRWGVQRLQLPGLRRFRDTTSLRMPVFGNLQREVAIAAFVRMLRKLHHAGVAPIAAWEAAANTASNVAIRDKFADAYVLMQSGATLPDAFAATGLFNNWVENVILTGHQSGEVVQSLDQIADFYQNQVQESAGRARRAMLQLGRLTMLIVGGLSVAWMCHSCYQKEFELTSTDGGF